MNNRPNCPVCGQKCVPLDVVDFNKSCLEFSGLFVELSGIPIYYFICTECQFSFAPEIAAWSQKEFEERIYNKDYAKVDPEYLIVRPEKNAELLDSLFSEQKSRITHIDYGGGNGTTVRLLNNKSWASVSFDPIADKNIDINTLGRFDLISAFEVFEHVADVQGMMETLDRLLKPDGVIFFSTYISDGNIARGQRINWWYAAPRNGHISLYSKKSLAVLAAQKGFSLISLGSNFHAYRKGNPDWAPPLFKAA